MLVPAWFIVPALIVGAGSDAPAPDAAALDALFVRMGGADAADRQAAAQELARAAPSGFDVYVRRLRRARVVQAEALRLLVLEAWGQVPNPNYLKDGNLWLRKPDPRWRPPKLKKGESPPPRPPRHDPERTEWISALAAVDVDGNPALAATADRAGARAHALEVVALLRAISASRRMDAVDPLFDFAFDLDGVFRDECGRAIRALGAEAVPGLIRRMRAPGQGVEMFRRRRYAAYQLDRMDRAQPHKTLQSAPDDRIRAEMLRAYGEVLAIDAVGAVLDHVDAPSSAVRRAARWAWQRYVAGPPPPEPPRRKRKLPGGETESVEKEDYLSHRQLALLALTRKLAALDGDPECARCPRDRDHQLRIPPQADAEAMTRALLERYDGARAAIWSAEFEAAGAKAAAGDLDGAVAGFSYILAHDPLYGRRGEVAGTYFLRGQQLLDGGDPARGEAMLQQAIALDPDSARARRVEAMLLLREARRRQASGIDVAADLRRALELDPSNDEARRALAAASGERAREHRLQESVVAAGALALALLATALWRLLRRPARPLP